MSLKYDKIKEREERKRIEQEKKQKSLEMLNTSAGAERSEERVFSTFFNKCTMSKVLDLILENPKIHIFTKDIVDKSGVSRKAVEYNINLLKKYGIINYVELGKRKFYTWNFKSQEAKHISKLRRILNDNVKLSE